MGDEYTRSVAAFCEAVFFGHGLSSTEKETFSGTVTAALVNIGESRIRKATRHLQLAMRSAGAANISSPYLLAQIGSAVSPVLRDIEDDWVARVTSAFLIGTSALELASLMDVVLWCGRWHQWGMPTVRVSQDQFSALALTDIAEEDLPSIAAPWPAMMVSIEGGFPVVIGEESPVPPGVHEKLGIPQVLGEHSCNRIAIHQFQGSSPAPLHDGMRTHGRPNWQIRLDVSGVNLWSGVKTVDEIRDNINLNRDANVPGNIHPDELESRAIKVASHAALNVLLAMQTDGYKKPGKTAGKSSRGKFGLWTRAEYVLGSDVKVSMLPAVHAYLTGNSDRTYKSRWTVRGHWRNQPCGIGMTERKRSWIKPHWAGRQEAPVRVRDHVL